MWRRTTTTPSDTISPATNMMLPAKSSAVKPNWKCCAVVPKGFLAVRDRSAHTRNMTVSIGMKEGFRKHGGRDTTQKIDYLYVSIQNSFSKSHPYAQDLTLI